MSDIKANHFNRSAAVWDAEPRRIELVRAVGKAILRRVVLARDMDVLDYGCGTGLLGLFLLPHVRSVTGADSSSEMLQVLEQKIRDGNLQQMQTIELDLLHDPAPESNYHLVTANMVMHHVDRIDVLLKAFYRVLTPGGYLAIADLDSEQGLFHGPEAAASVHHHGFDRRTFIKRLRQTGFVDVEDTTAHIIHKPIVNSEIREFPVFLMVARRPH